MDADAHTDDDWDDWDERLCLIDTARRLCSADIADIIIARLGGITVYVPVKHFADSLLGKTIGADATAKIATELGGVRFCVPIMHQRDAIVLSQSLQGKLVREIAKAAGCTERQVANIRARLRAQGKLPSRSQTALNREMPS